MAPRSLRDLAAKLGLPVHAVRRAAADGLIHGQRVGARRFVTTQAEENYLRASWELLRDLRDALRTEPLIRLAVLFGPAATDPLTEMTGVELLVDMNGTDPELAAEVVERLGARIGRPVQFTRLKDAEAEPSLMANVLREGRVLTDRDGEWPTLGALATPSRPAKAPEYGIRPTGQDGTRAEAPDEGAGQV